MVIPKTQGRPGLTIEFLLGVVGFIFWCIAIDRGDRGEWGAALVIAIFSLFLIELMPLAEDNFKDFNRRVARDLKHHLLLDHNHNRD